MNPEALRGPGRGRGLVAHRHVAKGVPQVAEGSKSRENGEAGKSDFAYRNLIVRGVDDNVGNVYISGQTITKTVNCVQLNLTNIWL